jgi:hypothetical protein
MDRRIRGGMDGGEGGTGGKRPYRQCMGLGQGSAEDLVVMEAGRYQ